MEKGLYCPLIKGKCIEKNCKLYIYKARRRKMDQDDPNKYEDVYDCAIKIIGEVALFPK